MRPLPFALLLLTLPVRLDAQIVAAAAPTGLQAAYAMSNGTDASGNTRTGILLNATTVPGKYGQAQRFTAMGRMTVPTFNVGATFTIESWVWMSGTTRMAVAATTDLPAGWQAFVYQGYDTYFLAEAGGFITAGFTPTGATAVVQVVSPTKTTAMSWHHVAAVYDGTGLSLYVDSLLTARQAASGAVRPSTRPVEIGGSATDGGACACVIDDVRIYSRALTASEIATDMATPVDAVREDVVSWDLEVWASGTTPATGLAIGTGTFPRSAAVCNLVALPPVVTTVKNPTKARASDPMNTGRECELTIQAFVQSLPVGVGYTSTLRAHGATTTGERSSVSNAFDRVAEAVPPAPAQTPTLR